MYRLGQEVRAAAFDGLPIDYDADRDRANAYLCQCQVLLDCYVNFRELVAYNIYELYPRLMSSYQKAEDVISGAVDRQVARAAASTFRAESEVCRPSKFAPRVLQEFDVKLRRAYINIWAFAEPAAPGELFIKRWSDIRENLIPCFAGCTGVGATSTGITQDDLDEARRSIPSLLTGITERLTSGGIQEPDDSKIVQALTLRGDIKPRMEAGTLHSYDFFDVMRFFDNWPTAHISGFGNPQQAEIVISSPNQLLDSIPWVVVLPSDDEDEIA